MIWRLIKRWFARKPAAEHVEPSGLLLTDGRRVTPVALRGLSLVCSSDGRTEVVQSGQATDLRAWNAAYRACGGRLDAFCWEDGTSAADEPPAM